MRNRISAPVPWRESINGWTDTLKAAGLSTQTIKSRRYKMVHLATLLMPDGPEDVATERIVHVFAEQQWKPETLKAYRNTIASFFRAAQERQTERRSESGCAASEEAARASQTMPGPVHHGRDAEGHVIGKTHGPARSRVRAAARGDRPRP